MQVIDLQGNRSNWRPTGATTATTKSGPHTRARELLKTLYFSCQILEEVSFNPAPKQTLFLDFYIPTLKIAVEVQGNQHDNYTPFFHKNQFNFGKAKGRDRDKANWCEINNIKLVELPEDEDENEWRKRFSQR